MFYKVHALKLMHLIPRRKLKSPTHQNLFKFYTVQTNLVMRRLTRLLYYAGRLVTARTIDNGLLAGDEEIIKK